MPFQLRSTKKNTTDVKVESKLELFLGCKLFSSESCFCTQLLSPPRRGSPQVIKQPSEPQEIHWHQTHVGCICSWGAVSLQYIYTIYMTHKVHFIQLHETNYTTSIILTMPGLHGLNSSSLFSIFSAYLEYPMSKTGSTSAMRSWATDSCEGRFNGSQLLNVIQLPQSACRFKVSSSKFTGSFLCSTIHAIRIQRYFSHWSHSDSNQTVFHLLWARHHFADLFNSQMLLQLGGSRTSSQLPPALS